MPKLEKCSATHTIESPLDEGCLLSSDLQRVSLVTEAM